VQRGLIRIGTLLTVLLLASCRTVATGGETGAPSSAQAVAQFIAAARAQDLQAMSAVWGNAEGPTRDRIDRQELERRLLIIICHLKHDESRIGPPQAGEAGRQLHMVELTQGVRTASVTFTGVKASRSDRWYVENVDLMPLRAFCNSAPAPAR
jgi:hypothetical protein